MLDRLRRFFSTTVAHQRAEAHTVDLYCGRCNRTTTVPVNGRTVHQIGRDHRRQCPARRRPATTAATPPADTSAATTAATLAATTAATAASNAATSAACSTVTCI